MFIHLGGDRIVHLRDVIAICNIEKGSKKNRAFLRHEETKNGLVAEGKEDVRSFVITVNGVYYSPISSVTLKKRAVMLLDQKEWTN